MEIKYRGYHLVKEKLLPIEMMDFRNNMISLNEGDNSLSDTFEMVKLSRYTGMKDKNDIEIYEGDIIEYTFDLVRDYTPNDTSKDLKVRMGEVFWSEFRGSFAIGTKNLNHDLFRIVRNGNRTKVVGNIFQNKELSKTYISQYK